MTNGAVGGLQAYLRIRGRSWYGSIQTALRALQGPYLSFGELKNLQTIKKPSDFHPKAFD